MNRKFLLFVALLVGALLFSACVVPPPAVAAPVVVGPLNEEGYPGPTTAQAKIDLGLDVQRLRTEHSAFVWRSFPNVVDVDCPSGYVCTVTLEDESIKVYQGQSGLKLRISAGTFRFIEGYSADDAVHGNPPCMLLKQEQDFGVGEVPSFVVSAGNFDCAVAQADPAMTEEPTAAPAATAAPVVTSCDNPSQWGGTASHWVWNDKGFWKYGEDLQAPSVTFKVPDRGRIDGDGWSITAGQAVPAGVSPTGIIATWWCE